MGQSSNTIFPLADPGCDSSENETTWPPAACRATRDATRKASPVQCKRRLTRNPPSTLSANKERGRKDVLDLESLLDGTTKSLNSGRKTDKEIAEMVNHDLAELERRQLGGIVSSESSDDEVEDEDVDETLHERVFGAEQAGKVSKMLKSDKSRFIKVVPWRPFWAANNGSNGKANVSVAHVFGSRKLTIVQFTIPPLDLQSDLHPTLKELKRVIHENGKSKRYYLDQNASHFP